MNFLKQIKAILGLGDNLEKLSSILEENVSYLQKIEVYYSKKTIPKKNGGKRELLIPDKHLKSIQKKILKKILDSHKSHNVAHGFEKYRSIISNAKHHVNKSVIVHMDIVDFFPSVKPAKINLFFRNIGWNKNAAILLTKLTTYENGLPQGAPTSPKLSNLVNYKMDQKIVNLAKIYDCTYTRYADDLTFSFKKDNPKGIRKFIKKATKLINEEGYFIHKRKKMSVRRKHQSQRVTGLVVNEKIQLPRHKRKWLRAVKHHFSTGKPATLSEEQLKGWLAFEKMINKTLNKN